MSYRNNWIDSNYDNHFSSLRLLDLTESADITLNISGLPVSLRGMAQAGWYCRIRYNKYGGRNRFSFYSKDGRSTITFRIAGRWYPALSRFVRTDGEYTEPELFCVLGEGNATSLPAPIPNGATDEELLAALNRNIKRRLKSRKPAVKKPVIEKAVAFAAAS
jgi:hypothetical protein